MSGIIRRGLHLVNPFFKFAETPYFSTAGGYFNVTFRKKSLKFSENFFEKVAGSLEK